MQALRFSLTRADAVLLTHSHADHLHGLDDLRIFAHTWNPSKVTKQSKASKPLCIYANAHTLHDVQNRFDYVFTPTREGGGKPNLSLCCADAYTEENPLVIGCLSVVGVPIRHGSLEVCGWKITDTTTHCSFAYITDCNYICDESVRLIHGVEHCVLDSLRKEKHSTHFCFSESLEYAQRIEANNTWITHICHDFSHAEISEWFTQHNPTDKPIQPAYDGLTLTC